MLPIEDGPPNCLLCKNCNDTLSGLQKKFCNFKCQQELAYKLNIEAWLNNEISGGSIHRVSHFVRRWLGKIYGEKCHNPSCGWDWTKPCGLEVEHKDGNSQNHRPENLMLICPNCHSQTPTYKNKNKGKGRAYRRDRYKEGKSY